VSEVAELLIELARETYTTSSLYYDLNQEDDSESYDSYSDQDENEINDTAVDASHFPVKSDRKGRASYMPPDGTPLFEYVSGIKRKLAEKSMQIRHNSLWIPPPFDPVAKGIGSEPVPDRWYIGDCWVYLWLPREQFDLDKLKCIYCGTNSTESAGLRYRPMFKWDTIVWCLYKRVRCTSSSCCASNRGKRRQFSTVDPRSLSLLPTSIAERFEFVTTEGRGLGMHRSMIHAFSNLTSKQVLYGSFVNMINELHRIRYSMAHISYLDCLVDWAPLFSQNKKVKRPFSEFRSVGHFNGVRLDERLLKKLYNSFMAVNEPYMQASFQCHVDEGCTGDDTHKFNSFIFLKPPEKNSAVVQPFGASWTSTNLNGRISIERIKFTKAQSEMELMMQQYKEARVNAGVLKLKRYETDNVKADRAMMQSFFPELKEDVTPFQPNTILPVASIDDEKIVYITTTQGANDYATAIFEKIKDINTVYYGLDAEWCRGDTVHSTPLFQFSFPTEDDVLLLHLPHIRDFPDRLKLLLELPNLVACGRQIGGDVSRLRELGIHVNRVIELANLAKRCNPAINDISLCALARKYLKLHIPDKDIGQDFNYYITPLPKNIQHYAAVDVLMTRLVTERLLTLTSDTDFTIHEAPNDLRIDSTVHVWRGAGRRFVMKGTVKFIGAERRTVESQYWGDKCVGKGRAIIKVDEVLIANIKPPFLFVSKSSPSESWDKDSTMGSLFKQYSQSNKDLEIMVRTCNLFIIMSPSASTPQELNAQVTSFQIASSALNEVLGVETQNSFDNSARNRSREKGDIFHQFDALPLTRSSPIAPYIFALLISATFIFNDDDYKDVERVLNEKGIVDKALHYYYNREFWKERIRMTTPSANEHSARIQAIFDFVKSEAALQEYLTKDFNDYFTKFIANCKMGHFEELHDVTMFRYKGKDANGLNLYYRLRGARAENVHQKMHVSVGPWGIGPRSGHYILLDLCFRYNVNAGIARCGDHDFGHPWLYFIDRIQDRVQKIWNLLIYPNHTNILAFKPTEFVAVGIGPLSYDLKYVDTGEPMPHFKGDLKFLAERMKLKCPPLPLSTKQEHLIYNDYLKSHPQPATKNWDELAQIFKNITNGKTVFPKLPSMLKRYYDQWSKNQSIKMIGMQIRGGYNQVLLKLSSERAEAAPFVLQEQGIAHNTTSSTRQPVAFVPPSVAPYQTHEILMPTTEKTGRSCAWYPFCKANSSVCGGRWRDSCNVYGKNGTKTPPTDEELKLARKKEFKDQTKHCFWWPICTQLSHECGGTRRDKCSIYGKNGTKEAPPFMLSFFVANHSLSVICQIFVYYTQLVQCV